MARVIITASADADTNFILDNLIAKAGVNVAARYNADFDSLYQRLEIFPDSGAPRRALGSNLRIGVVSPYNVIHEHVVIDNTFLILRIVHGRRRITRRMLISQF